ncbi:MAG: hypothetical protein WKF84_13620 [Pyrinomonadaceae bacterium]
MTVIGSIALFVYVLLIIRKPTAKVQIIKLTSAISLSLLATAAFYWVTVVAELPWIHTEYIETNLYYDYRRNFLFSPFTLLSLNTWYANALALATIGLFHQLLRASFGEPLAGGVITERSRQSRCCCCLLFS